MKRFLVRGLDFSRFIAARFGEDRLAPAAASLTFTTLLALVPLITIAVSLVSAFPVFSAFSIELKKFLLLNMAPQVAGKIITVYMQQFADNAARLTATGIVLLGVTAMMLMLTIDRTLNGIWRVTSQRPIAKRLVIYWAVLTLGPILMGASLSLTSWLVSVSAGLAKQIPGGASGLVRVMPVLLTTLAFTLVFVTVPNRRINWRHALAGGAVAALAFEAMKSGFALYIARFPSYKLVYGTFAAVPIFLLWIYLSWLTVLIGALVSAALSDWSPGRWRERRVPGSRFVAGLRLMQRLVERHRSGEVTRLERLARELAIGATETEWVVSEFARAGWVRQVQGGGVALVRDPREIRVEQLVRLLMFDPQSWSGSGAVERRAASAFAGLLDTKLQMSLEEYFAGAGECAENNAQENGRGAQPGAAPEAPVPIRALRERGQ